MQELDLKDWKILFELDLDSRQSLQSIGKKTNLSKEVVNYRIKKLKDDGIITSFFARIDTSKLGLMIFRTFLRLYNLTPDKEKDLLNYLTSNENVGWCVSVDGNWDVNFLYWAKSISEFSSFWKEFLSKYGDFIEEKRVSIFDKYIQYPKLFLQKEKKLREIPEFCCGGSERKETDAKDLKILALLASNSRTPTVEIAKKAKLSAKMTSQRIKILKKNEIIVGFGISLNLEKINFEYFKLHLNFKRFDKKRFEDLLGFCKHNPYIIYSNQLIGGADLELDIYAPSNKTYRELVNEIRYNFPDLIKDFETLQYSKELKHNLLPRSEK